MKFSDIILAVATTVLIWVLLYFAFGLVLIPSALGSYWGQNAAGLLSLLISGLVVGFVFAGKIQEESRMRAVGKITVLITTVMLFFLLISFSGNSYFWAYVEENLQSMFSTGAWTTMDWFVYEQFAIGMNLALNIVLSLVLGFIGLYAGSMLRKPKKT